MTATAAERLDAVLARIHERWVESVSQILAPATSPGAGFWERWGAARFLTDRFASFYRLESTLLESLETSLAPGYLARLRQGLGEIERTRSKLVGMGRRRGTAVDVAREARTLLSMIRRWSTDFETATRAVTDADLPPGTRELLESLEGAGDSAP